MPFSDINDFCHDTCWTLVSFMIAVSALIKVPRHYGFYEHLHTSLSFLYSVSLTFQYIYKIFLNKCFLHLNRVISVLLGQYHGCWCPGSLCRQDISSNDIDCVEFVGTGLTWGRILSTCVISMWSNDTKCKNIFIFPLKNLAGKELIWNTRSPSPSDAG